MKALVVYAHPREGSFTAAVRDGVLAKLDAAGAEVRLFDLYAEGFDPVLSAQEHTDYLEPDINRKALVPHVDALEWCDTLIFIYPTWWYGLPAMLKGWLDRVLLPGVAFHMPQAEGETIGRGLTHINRLGVFTTCGASWWLTRVIGAPGRRTLMRGVRLLCARRCRTAFAAHYLMDSSSDASREKHLRRVAKEMDRFLAGQTVREEVTA
ncbi:NAD(P)H dehydrogenase (quinone) [Primorskyibacter flagellatus]|uniref:NAD(P)H dehydrogenase (Quinone) n=1 Tax=Primorskyibacter flagellatus TaxID=1387277 RepID=A0A917A3Z2_9RHOB|nr:NAD(P)H-dependent oxidoreductase [Primorskyibacter flagellatus]GGE24711.1 NAD(P)H dehydrogenase (quinone) [Primorskyibacter flagellatus]